MYYNENQKKNIEKMAGYVYYNKSVKLNLTIVL